MLHTPHLRVRWPRHVLNTRRFHISTAASPENVTIPSSANGRISLDIHRPTASRPVEAGPIILFLPRGITSNRATTSTPDATLAAHLSHAAAATTVQVNYRLSSSVRYPTPVYDVLAAYDWILSNLIPKQQTQHKAYELQSQNGYGHSRYAPPRPQQARLGVYGNLIGGSLAMMLALTECKVVGEPGRIAAAAFKDPIVDWTAFMNETPQLTSTPPVPKRKRKIAAPRLIPDNDQSVTSHDELHQTLTNIFPASNPSSYFSPFASPIHFLRTPATAVPTNPRATSALDPSATDFDILAALEADDLASRSLSSATTSSPTPNEPETTTTRRKVPLRYPPSGLAPMAMPEMFVRASSAGALREQNEEMVRLLRRAWLKYGYGALGAGHGAEGAGDRFVDSVVGGGEGGLEDGERKEELRNAAEAKVVFDVVGQSSEGGISRHGGMASEEEEMERVGQWFARVLR